MELRTRATIELIQARVYCCKYSDFDATIYSGKHTHDKPNAWRKAYFDLLSWRNTWEIPLELDLLALHNHEAYVRIVIKDSEDVRESVESMLSGMGYKYITSDRAETAGIVDFDTYQHRELLDVDEYYFA